LKRGRVNLKEYYLGIDTSNYTTSLAIIDSDKKVVADERMVLEVPLGKRGLSQSEAFFLHNKNLPLLFERIKFIIKGGKLKAVAASTAPRPVPNSYMPVFLLGSNYGKVIASINDLPFVGVTHQEGHIAAGIWSSGMKVNGEKFLAVHLSGGTTELVQVELDNSSLEESFIIKILGKSSDLQIGQFIDRVGVALGLNFPAGKDLEQMASRCKGTKLRLPIVVKDNLVSFSGPESAAQRVINTGQYSKEEVALAVQICISESITRLVRNCIEAYGFRSVLFIGGVASNDYFRTYLCKNLIKSNEEIKLFFADKHYSSDNAVGVGLLGLERLNRNAGFRNLDRELIK